VLEWNCSENTESKEEDEQKKTIWTM